MGNMGKDMTRTRTHLGQTKHHKFFPEYVYTDNGALLN